MRRATARELSGGEGDGVKVCVSERRRGADPPRVIAGARGGGQ